jgi:murein DD-endopeptidase MepM/ murein hydrolase activator NlpD
VTAIVDFLDLCSRHARYFVAALLVLVNVLLLSVLASSFHATPAAPVHNSKPLSSLAGMTGNSSNVVTNLLIATSGVADQIIDTTNRAVMNSVNSIASVTANFGQVVTDGLRTISSTTIHGIGAGFSYGAHGLGSAAHFLWQVPFKVMGAFNSAPAVNAFVMPASAVSVPVIDVGRAGMLPPTQPAAQVAIKPTPPPTPTSTPRWPIHGAVTTAFGVPEPPFQPIHTGVDISDGTYPGTTPIHAFKPGRVLNIIHSPYGLGNHVILDHGNGLTSVYGHMSSTSVVVGQTVDQNTILGYEGSTGASTGTHLHFEIRQDGVAMNPFNYIAGQP